MKKLLAILLLCAGVASAQIPYNAYPPAGPLTGTEKVLINQGGSDGLYLTTTASIADLFGGSVFLAFNNVTSGTNTNSLVLGSGGTLSFSGSGTINANLVNGAAVGANLSLVNTNSSGQLGAVSIPLSVSLGGIGATSFAAAALPTYTGSITAGHCTYWVTSTTQGDAGFACGSGGGSGAFSSLTSGTNTTATMGVGTGASLSYSGTGVINADQVSGAAIPTSAQLLATNVSNQLTALTLGANLVEVGTVIATSQAINSQIGTSYAVQTTDAGALITFNNASAVAVSLNQATTPGYTSGFSFDVQNKGAGTVTITPATSTINGVSTLAIIQNTGCTITSDGGNYQVSACTAVSNGSGGGGAFSSIGSGTNTTATMTVGSGASLTYSGTGVVNANELGGSTLAAYFGALPVAIGNTSGAAGTYTYSSALGLDVNTEVVELKNSTLATGTPAAQQAFSPALQLEGQGWQASGSVSEPVDWQIYVTPFDGFSAPTSTLQICNSSNGGAYSCNVNIQSAGYVVANAMLADGTAVPGSGTGINNCSGSVLGFFSTATSLGCWGVGATGLVAKTPVYTGGTTFTVSGCGAAGTPTGTGAAGTFTVGTGAGTCTFTITINGATGLTANHGWITNMDDVTAHLHCTNTTGGSATTSVVLCNSTVGTGDTIVFTSEPY